MDRICTLLMFLLQPWTTGAQINCLLPLPPYMVAWETTPPHLQIQFDLSKVCHDSKTCFGQGGNDPGTDALHQLPPLITQPGAVLTFDSSIGDMLFHKTDEDGFHTCNFSSPNTHSINGSPTLQSGSNYFIATSNSISWLSCQAGLRLNVSVFEEQRCLTVSGEVCSSSGQCVAQPWEAVYKCVCCQSYYGELCEMVDGCYANKLACMNGGTCVDGPDDSGEGAPSFTCKCIGGYTGRYCQSRNTVVCPRNECSNGGECNLNSSSKFGFTCTCPLGFHGNLCEVDIDECLSSPCLNNGTCANGRNSYSCTCLEDFTGLRCENDERPCRPGVCFNGATCIVEGDRPICECPIGFEGTTCMTEVLTCHHQPCSEHSIDCVMDKNNDFTCICKAGFTGQKCDVDIDECVSNPCGVNGVCVDGVAGYQCRCQDGTTGRTCVSQGSKGALENSANSSSTPESSSSPGKSLVIGVIVILLLMAMLILLVFLFVRFGILSSGRRRKIYAIEIRNLNAKDRMNSSPREFLGDDDHSPVRSCMRSKVNKPLFRRSTKKTERF